MTKHTSTVFELLAKGRFSDIEKICINHPQLREILLHWKGIRKTAFFKNRLKFYRQFAQRTNIREFTPELKNQIRDEFAQENCLKQILKRTYLSLKNGADTTMPQDTLLCFLKRRRRGRLGLF